MTILDYMTQEGDISTTNTTWTTIATRDIVFNRPTLVWLYCEYTGSVTNRNVNVRLIVNGNEQSFDYHTPSIAGAYKQFYFFSVVSPPSQTLYTIEIQARVESSPQQVTVRRLRLAAMQE